MRKTVYRCTWLCVTLAIVTTFLILHPPAARAADDMTLWEDACAKIDAGDLAGAKDSLNQLLEQYPASPKAPAAQLKLAYIKIRTSPESTGEILNAFSLVRTKYPSSQEAAVALVRIGYLHSKTDTLQAIADFTAFLSSYPDHQLAAEIQQSLGRLYLRTLELDKAEAAFDKAVNIGGAPTAVAEEAALQSGFVKIMKYYASKGRSHLAAAIDALSALVSSSSVKIRARADLGVAEAMLLQGQRTDARERYGAAAQTYAGLPYFRGVALYGVACCSQQAGQLDTALLDYAAFLAAQQGSTLGEKDAAWRTAALASTSASARAVVESDGAWERLPGSDLVCRSVFDQGRCLYWLKRYDEATDKLSELVQYLPPDTELHTRAVELTEQCNTAKGGG